MECRALLIKLNHVTIIMISCENSIRLITAYRIIQ